MQLNFRLLIETFARVGILFASKEKARGMRGFILINDRLSTLLTPLENKRTIVQSPLIVKTIIVCATLFLLGGCNIVYKADIQQGNDITAQVVAQLAVGMSKQEVIRIAGSPLINDPFHKDQWDYYYSKRNGKTGETVRQSASLTFTDGLLSEITSSFN